MRFNRIMKSRMKTTKINQRKRSNTCIDRTNYTSIERTNNNLLIPHNVTVDYESKEIINTFSLPRRYTYTLHHINIGKEYTNDDNSILGEWIEINNKYEINFIINVSSNINKIGLMLEEIAYVETRLLLSNPGLDIAKVYITFKYKHDETKEYWHRFGHWSCINK